MNIIKFEKIHLDLMLPGEHEKERLSVMNEESVDKLATVYEKNKYSFTAINNGNIIACGGILDLWPGVGEIWMIVSDYRKENKFGIAKHAINIIRNCGKEYHRLQASVKSDYTVAKRFIEWLGFENEGNMKMYSTDKNDFTRYARTI